jgi:hypothetical protein
MTVISKEFLKDGKSFVTKTEDTIATVVRTSTGAALTQTEIELAGDYYNSDLEEIDYAKIYNLKFGTNYLGKLGASDEWMAKALTDKTYKDIFKKATGKNSSNISSEEPATTNIYATIADNNKDANGTSTVNRGGSILRYPKNDVSGDYDYLKVCAYEYKPRNFGEGGIGLTGDYGEPEDRGLTKKKGSHTVFLPMEPQGLAEGNSADWGDDRLNALTAALANTAGDAIKSAEDGAAEAAKAFTQGLGDTFNKIKDEIGPDKVAAYFAGEAVGNKGVFKRATGQVMNPNLELLFNGPTLRQFAYNFRFTPREKNEAEEVRKIIRFFKYAMAPSKSDTGMFLKSPHVFKLKYYYKNGQQHPFLNKIKTCALTSFQVQYAPDGSYMTYDDGSMTSYTVSMGFGELNPIYAEDNEEDTNDMGY